MPRAGSSWANGGASIAGDPGRGIVKWPRLRASRDVWPPMRRCTIGAEPLFSTVLFPSLRDSMARVTVEDCIEKVPNRFSLVLLSAHRARAISAGSQILVDRDNDKNPVAALR